MNTVGSSSKIDQLASQLQTEGVDALFATTPITMGYLTGFRETGHERFLSLAIRSDGQVRMICPALSATQATKCGIKDVRSWRDGEEPMEHFSQLAEDWNLRAAILAVDDEMPAHILLRMQSILPAALFKQGQEIVSRLMRSKDSREIDLMRRAAMIADDSYGAGLLAIRESATELEVTQAIWAEMGRRGGNPTFCIIAAGANSAEPHHVTDATPIRAGDVVILDYGCGVEGYQSDVTKTLSVGAASQKVREVYRVVYGAQAAARAAIRPGVTAGAVDAAARKVIEAAGYGEYFVHRTGHGIGARGHEEPYIVGGSEFLLEVGNCFSIEPGIYLPGQFGVRIETIVTVTSDGHESLNEEPAPEILELGV